MQFKNLTTLALHNRLISLNLSGLKPAAASFNLPQEPVLLEISAQGTQFILACADEKALLNLPELKARAEQLKDITLPRAILAAFLELYLSPYLKEVGKALQATITVTGYGENFEVSKFPLSFAFYHELGELRLPFVFMCKNEDALRNLLQKLDEIYFARKAQLNDDSKEDLPVILNQIAGMSVLSAHELASLEEGDAVVIDRFCLQENKLTLGFADLIAEASISAGKVTLSSGFGKNTLLDTFLSPDKDKPMSDNKNAATPASPLENMDDLKFEVNFILDRQVMTLAKLKALKVGAEIPLGNHDLSNVSMEVNGQCVAIGRIIDLGDRFGFQIMHKGK